MSDLYDELVNRYFAKWELERASKNDEENGAHMLYRYAVEGARGRYGCGLDFSTRGGHVQYWRTREEDKAKTVTVAQLVRDAYQRHCAPVKQPRLL